MKAAPVAQRRAARPRTAAASTRFLAWAAAVMIALAAALTIAIRGSELLPGEGAAARWIAAKPGAPGELVADFMDAISSNTAAPIVFLIALFAVWRMWGNYHAAVFGVAGLLTAATKLADLADRPRPTPDLQWTNYVAGEGGFPSQHVVYAVLVFGMLALLAGRNIRFAPLRRAAVALFVALVALMGPARVITADHWPADVAGGYLIAVPMLIVLVYVCDRVWRLLQHVSTGRLAGASNPISGPLAGFRRRNRTVPPRRASNCCPTDVPWGVHGSGRRDQ